MKNQINIGLKNIDSVYCVGIGGVGVSAIARFFANEGVDVSGSDASTSPILDGLRDEGIAAEVGHEADNLPEEVDLVIYSIAVPHDNPELTRARELDIPTFTYPQALGLISEQMKTIAVSGTHGKTTTTAMLADIFASSRLDPTIIVGSMLKGSHTNFVAGDDDLFVVEACEYKRSFLEIHPDILVITNIDNDHLDYFSGLKDIQKAFAQMVDQVSEDGAVVCSSQNEHTQPAVADAVAEVVSYSDVDLGGNLQVFGDHNRQNGRAAVQAAQTVGVDTQTAKRAVRNFSGTWRRAQKKGQTEAGAVVYDDYGHHPTEIRSTLAGFKERFPDRKLVVIFQPHLFSRTRKLLDQFADSFEVADKIILLPIYAARESPDTDISSGDLADKLQSAGQPVYLAEDFDDARAKAKELADENSVIITQGAGDVYEVADKLAGKGGNK